MNRDVEYQADVPVGGRISGSRPLASAEGTPQKANQLRTLSHIGFFDQPLDERARPRFSNPYDAAADLNERARAWLHVNCSHCHREGAGGSVVSHFDYDTPLGEMKAIGRVPSQGTLGLTQAHVISPGSPESSVLYYRVSTTGQGRMPLIGSRHVDVAGLRLLHDWIEQLPKELSEDKTPAAPPPVRVALREHLQRLWNPSSTGTEVDAALESLLSSTSGALILVSAINERSEQPSCPPEVAAKAGRHPSAQVRDLFERFVPDELRPKKLGLNIVPQTILDLRGDSRSGEALFLSEAVQCTQCHRLQGSGRDFGPDLSQIGRKYGRAQLLDQILNPSKLIDPAFVTYQVETSDGGSYAGFLVKRSSEELVLKDSTLNQIRIPAGRVKAVQAQQLSAMPEGLLQSITAQDAADLIAFLVSLR
jgi:putative heme-binding domain-containing protein